MATAIVKGGTTSSAQTALKPQPVVFPVPAGMVQFVPQAGPQFGQHVRVRLGDTAAISTAGDDTIDRVEIPKLTALTVWKGRDPITLQIPVRLDALMQRRSVEPVIRQLDEFRGRDRKGTPAEPTDLVVDAGGWVQYDYQRFPDLRWWIEGIDWDDDPESVIRRSTDGHRMRQLGVIQLVQINRPDVAAAPTTADKARARLAKDSANTHKIVAGDTLRSLSVFYYGNALHARDIAVLNGLGVKSTLKAGRVLRLP